MVDLQKLVDSFHTMTCIVSVEKLPDGKAGTIRIEAGNERYIRSLENVNVNCKYVFKEKSSCAVQKISKSPWTR